MSLRITSIKTSISSVLFVLYTSDATSEPSSPGAASFHNTLITGTASNFFKKYEKNYWETLKIITPIHKLSNKYLVPKDYSQTYYEMFKEGKL